MITLVDSMGFYYMNFHMIRRQLKNENKLFDEDSLGFFAHAFLNSVHSLFYKYENLIFCWEGFGSLDWRRSIFPDYKRNRDATKSDDEFITVLNFAPEIEELMKNYPCKNIKVDGAEADDVIFALSEKYQNEDEVLILTGDKDLSQIMNHFDNVSMINPIFRKEFVKNENIVFEKAICGDTSDNIPGLYRVGPKTFEKMLKNRNEWNKIINKGNNKKIFEDFVKIVDLTKVPSYIHEKAKKIDEAIEVNFYPSKVEEFLEKYKLEELKKKWPYFKMKLIEQKGIDIEFKNSYNDDLDNVIGKFV